MRRHRFVWLLTLSLLVMALASAATPSAQATVEVQRFIDLFVFDESHPCTGESVELSGELQITERVVTDSEGGVHTTFHLVPLKIRGIGPNGERLMIVGGAREHIIEAAGGLPFTDTFTSMFNIVSQGGGDNFMEQITVHITVNENGDVTAEVEHVQEECRG